MNNLMVRIIIIVIIGIIIFTLLFIVYRGFIVFFNGSKRFNSKLTLWIEGGKRPVG